MDISISHLEVEKEQFKLNENESYIIFGPNGVGKSSIYRALQEKNKDEYDFLDYDIMRTNYVTKKGKRIDVNPFSSKIANIREELESVKKSLDVSVILKSFDISNQAKAKEISQYFLDLQKQKYIHDEIILSKEDFDELERQRELGIKETDILFAISNYKEITESQTLKKDINLYKDTYLNKTMKVIESNLSKEDDICPICDSKVKNLRQIISEKIKNQKVIEQSVILKYEELNNGIDTLSVATQIENIVTIVDLFSEQDLTEYLLLKNDYSNKAFFNKNIDKLRTQEKLLIQTESELMTAFDNLLKCKDKYTTYIRDKFNVEVNFDEEDYSVNVELTRPPADHSTGEFNVILFSTKIFEFMGGEKKYLVLDDPLSSYDKINQYRIIFDLVSSRKEEKNFIVFTHNLDMINLMNTQYAGLFHYKIMDSIAGKINLLDLGLAGSNSLHSIENILTNSTNNKFNAYAETVMKRDNPSEPKSKEMHQLFHYDKGKYCYIYNSIKLCNTELIDLIDNLSVDSFSYIDALTKEHQYSTLTVTKITYMIALRVWIEKKLFDVVKDKELFAKKCTLRKKINYVFQDKQCKEGLKNKYPKLVVEGDYLKAREKIMSKTVMLNQHNHFESQGVPFYYVYNLTTDQIVSEISEVKNMFEK